jgi:hypothetical protein
MTPPAPLTLIDGHVHVRASFDPSRMLSGAIERFDRAAGRLGAAPGTPVLMLAEAEGEEAFERWAGRDEPVGRWRFVGSGDPCSLKAERDDGRTLLIVQGRQWTCADRLEVLTQCSGVRLRDGMTAHACIEDGLAAGALVVLPWGFGKWLGERREAVLRLIDRYGSRICVSDSAARPGGRDPVLASAAARAVPFTAGTDPLPLRGHESRAGSYGFVVPERSPAAEQSVWLRGAVLAGAQGAMTFGRRDGLLRSLLTQVRLRMG